MAFSVPTPVFSRGVRRYVNVQNGDLQKAKEKFKPSSDLFCSRCIKNGLITEAYGFCKVCKDFLCRKCVDLHESTLLTLNHGIIVGNEMETRYLHAMRKDKKPTSRMSRNYIDMLADGRASFMYEESVKPDSPREGSPNTKDAVLIREPKIRVAGDTLKCFICACVVYPDGKIVLADANNKSLKLFNKHFNNLFVFLMKQEPWDMCRAINMDQDLFVTENRVQGIHQFKVGKEIQYVFTVKVDGECFGITNWKGGVAASVKKDGKFSIKLFDQFGNIHKNFPDKFNGELKLLSPWYMTSTKRGRQIIVSDAAAGTVSGISPDGEVTFISKHKRTLKDPRNITSDEDDNIYVVEYETDTLHQLSPTGEDQGVILCSKDGLNNPCGIAYFDSMIFLHAKMDSNFMQVYDVK